MKLTQTAEGDFIFCDIEPWLAHDLTTLFLTHDPSQATVAARLLTEPHTEDDQLCEDWEEHVHPGLLALWKSCHQMVVKDLYSMSKSRSQEKNKYDLPIPKAHYEAWLRALTMIRLSLVAEYGLTEEELQQTTWPPDFSMPHGEVLAHLMIFASMQQELIEVG